ncbi:alpha/beta hydrolase [Paractinoplanes atraurantiacus]|uniref:alpha/beta hydrolase n=1 Tax=Paractinoplanes atraurantiacus TaxID=1036182 RepID=UPI0015CF4CD9|nr:alpha/beta hydrolase fold domain-containing protein [Actinoplanes atraurantiacus]
MPKPDVDESWVTVGDVAVRLVRPPGAVRVLPSVLYLHGGGFAIGNSGTHDRLIREIAVGASVAVAFAEFDGPCTVALEQTYAVARWIRERGRFSGLDGNRLAVAGDETGGALAAVLSATRFRFTHQSLYYPRGLPEFALPGTSPDTFVVARGPDDEGSALSRRLTAAGVRTTTVTYEDAPPHFMMLNSLRSGPAADAAVRTAIGVLRRASYPERTAP